MENNEEENLNQEPEDNGQDTSQDMSQSDDNIQSEAETFEAEASASETLAAEGPESEIPEDEAPEDLTPAGNIDTETLGTETHETEIDDPARRAPGRDIHDIARDIEAVLFISSEPVTLEVLAEVAGVDGEGLAHAVEAVREKYSDPDGGIMFSELAGGYTFRTGDLARAAVENFCRRPIDYTLSPAAMETIAIIAYLQPITRPEIARIRGVGADTVVANLLDKGLVEEAGRHKQTGAVRYRTTSDFEKLFGLSGLSAMPSLDGFEATAQDVEELREKLHLAAEKRQ
ncbi:MAG: SMC-Scp complex subunit ScpB [Thermoleophilia bacterium]